MEDNFEQKSSGQVSEEWRERLTHDEVMEKLSKIHGYEKQVTCDYGYCMQWFVDAPKVGELRNIVDRGVVEEIVYLIHQYGRALPPSEPPRGCTACTGGKWNVTVIPEEIQEMIAKRGVAVEISTFVSVSLKLNVNSSVVTVLFGAKKLFITSGTQSLWEETK